MNDPHRGALSEYTEGQRQLRSAWDSFHRRALRQTFIHCRLAMDHLLSSVIILEEMDPGGDTLGRFFEIVASDLPLDKAGNFSLVFHPPELKPLGPVNKSNLSESISDWMITSSISRGRAFEHLTLTQETVNLTIKIIEKRYPRFIERLNR